MSSARYLTLFTCIAACSATPAPAHSSQPPQRAQGLTYEVVAGPGARTLSVDATFAAGSPSELSVDTGAEPFVRDVQIEQAGVWLDVPPQGSSWLAPACTRDGCHIRYQFMLADAAKELDDVELALDHEGTLVSPPSTWLLHPLFENAGRPYRFAVTTPPELSFVTGVFRAEGAKSAWQADVTDLVAAPYSAFGPLRRLVVHASGGDVDIAIAPGRLDLSDADLLRWIESSARAVSTYFKRFPVERVLLIVLPIEGKGLGYARTLGNGGASIVAPLGRDTAANDMIDDWVMTHELVHLAFPTLGSLSHRWLEEGIATYIEPIARSRIGTLKVDDMWRGLLRGLPNGLPEPGDHGLDHTPTWGRTYWGGALYCLLADIEIRTRTNNRKSLDDALVGILDDGGNVAARWTIERTLAAGDRATGVPVLRELYDRMRGDPVAVDLAKLTERLGVSVSGRAVVYDDKAPLAAIRRAITSPRM
jgi:predicted metalloprotease with PDZ domain